MVGEDLTGQEVDPGQSRGERGARRTEHLRDRPLFGDPTLVQHGDPVGEHYRVEHVVGHDHRGGSAGADLLGEELADLRGGLHIQRGERFVQ